MYAGIVGSCRIKIEDFSMFLIKNHLSLHLLLSLHSLSQVKPTHVFFHLPPHGSFFGVTDHMTSNSSLFTMFLSHPVTSSVTLADGSTFCVLGSKTIQRTPLITLTSVLSLPQFSFNLISVCKLPRTLNYSISFFPDYCLIQDLSMKRAIGRGRESGGLYILETEVPTPVDCFGVVTPFELHCRLGHLLLSLLKKLYPQFSSLSSFKCESCQYAKLHRVHLSPRVNKRAFSPFELVHSNFWVLVQRCLRLGLNISLPWWMISLVSFDFI